MERMDHEKAEKLTYDICSKLNYSNFPGMDKLGLNPDSEHDMVIADAIIFALAALRQDDFQNCRSFGELMSMIKYRVVDVQEVFDVIYKWRQAMAPQTFSQGDNQ